nr:response regulator [Bradyrhizobium sp. 195]
MVEALREAGYHVIHASTDEEALAWCERHVADVLVTDVRLPGHLNGWQIAERYREQSPELPVIYATGFSPSTPRPVPASRIVKKPFHPEEIIRMIRELGEGKGHRGVAAPLAANFPRYRRLAEFAFGRFAAARLGPIILSVGPTPRRPDHRSRRGP